MLIDWVCGKERFRLHLVCTSGPRAKYLKFLSGPPVWLRGTYYGVHKYYDFYVFVVVILVLKVKKWHPFCSREWMNLRRVNLLKPVSFFLTFSCYLPLICLNLSKRTYSSKFCLDHYHEERSRKFTVNFKEEFVWHCQLSSSKWRLYLYLLRHWAREMNSSWFII